MFTINTMSKVGRLSKIHFAKKTGLVTFTSKLFAKSKNCCYNTICMLTTMFLTTLVLADYAPCDPKATREVRRMLNRIKSLQGKYYISGQTDMPDLKWVQEHTGKTPVILNLDFMRTPKKMGGQTGDVQEAIKWVKNNRGLVSFQWHWTSPTGTDDLGKGFYTKSTTFDLAKTLANPESNDYKVMVSEIDDVAEQIKLMSKAGVPVIFRPLHEAQGTWFWWGAKGAKPCVDLYNLIFDRMTNHHRLHNIAWAWTAYPDSQNKGKAKDWYPGDDKVDFVVSDYCEKKQDYDDLVALTGGKKMVALAETMNAPHPDKTLSDIPWAYWVTWAKRDWNDKSAPDIKAAMNHPKTLSLDEFAKL